ncbi:MAG: biopolymer transporter ExbD [Thermoguttaceae bacterium]|nr:biopolymer transporter ExbD [Thermoguttaceae bacterium]
MLARKIKMESLDLNMTSMIDIVFLLISFFTLVLNFSQAEQNEEIRLPASELAQPPEVAPAEPLTLQIKENGSILLGQLPCYLDGEVETGRPLSAAITEELRVFQAIDRAEPKDVTVIIRADENLQTGFVQKIMTVCQNAGMDNFIFRARQATDEF